MAAYRADIEIGVKGIQQLQNVTKQIQTLSAGVDAVSKKFNGATQSLNAYNLNLAKAAAALNNANAGTIAERDAVRLYVQALGQANAARDRQNKLIQEQISLQRKAVATADAGFGVQGPALPGAQGLGRSRGRGISGGGAGNALSSAIIGGGFPLLFGQGPAAAAGGAIGGLAGGLLGGGFGFALSIAGTAIGDLIAETDKLNVSLAGLNASLNSTSASSITTAADISSLAKNLQLTKDEALELVAAFGQFTNGNVREALAGGFGAVGGAQTFEAIAKAGVGEKEALDAIFALRKQIGNEAAEQLALQLRSVGAVETQAALLNIVSDKNIDILVSQAQTVQYADRLLSAWENVVTATASAVSLATQFIAKMQEGSLIKLPFLDKIQQVLGRLVARTPEQIAQERGNAVETQLRNQVDDIRKALREETKVLGTQARLGDAMSTKKQGKSAEEREAERLAQQKQKQLEYAARLAVSADVQVQKAVALTDQEKLAADVNMQRMERMVKYETLYRNALSNAEIEYLYMAQSSEIIKEKLEYEKELLDIALEQSRVINATDPLGTLNQEIDLIAAKLQGKEEEYRRQQAIDALVSKGVVLQDAINTVDAVDQLNARLREQQQLQELVNTVGQGMGDVLMGVFDGLISKTESFNDVLRSTLAGLGRFLMMAGLNALADMGDPSGQSTGILSFLGFGKRAGGGAVANRRPYVVGERGPELFVPGTGGTVVNNRDLRDAMGNAPGARNGPMLNMTFQTTNIGGVEYVSRDQLEAAMVATRKAAANDGAKRGTAATLSKLQNSPSTRAKLGLR